MLQEERYRMARELHDTIGHTFTFLFYLFHKLFFFLG
nr:histidine kinase dimerization/phosphoacceptor domain-containing protein [Aneurinibacillus migulanus]